MDTEDRDAFARAFNRLTLLSLRDTPSTGRRKEAIDLYFGLLRAYSIDDVRRAAVKIAENAKRFPTPAEWREAIGVSASPVSSTGTLNAPRRMNDDQAREYHAARRTAGIGAECHCDECRGAGVGDVDRPPRFVPTEHRDGYERVFDPISGKVVDACHWAHGTELRAWYDARDKMPAARMRTMRHGVNVVSFDRARSIPDRTELQQQQLAQDAKQWKKDKRDIAKGKALGWSNRDAGERAG